MDDAAEREGTAGTLSGRCKSIFGMAPSYPRAQALASLRFLYSFDFEALFARACASREYYARGCDVQRRRQHAHAGRVCRPFDRALAHAHDDALVFQRKPRLLGTRFDFDEKQQR